MDRVELDAQVQLNKKYAGIIDKLSKRISRNRKYSKKLLRRNKILSELMSKQNEVIIDTKQSEDQGIKHIFNKNSEYIFRNMCMTTVYGRVPSIALWNSEDISNFSSDYWSIWSEDESNKIIQMLLKNYKNYFDLNQFINERITSYKNDNVKNYNNLVLKNLADWLFC